MIKFKIPDKQFTHKPVHFDDIETITENGFRFYKTPHGNMKSMTSVLKALDDGGIESWRKRVGDEEADAVSNDASGRGERLHDLCEKYVNNDLSWKDHKSRAQIKFKRIKEHINKFDNIATQEGALYSKRLQIAGRVDLIGELYNKLTSADYKSSSKPLDLSKGYIKRKLFKYFLQAAGYAIMFEEMTGIPIHQLAVIVASEGLNGKGQMFVEHADFYKRELDKLVNTNHNVVYYNFRTLR